MLLSINNLKSVVVSIEIEKGNDSVRRIKVLRDRLKFKHLS